MLRSFLWVRLPFPLAKQIIAFLVMVSLFMVCFSLNHMSNSNCFIFLKKSSILYWAENEPNLYIGPYIKSPLSPFRSTGHSLMLRLTIHGRLENWHCFRQTCGCEQLLNFPAMENCLVGSHGMAVQPVCKKLKRSFHCCSKFHKPKLRTSH